MSNGFKEYLTKDGEVFRTNVDIGKTQTKDYDLKTLETAESRVQRGTNKTLETALKSITSLKKGNKKKEVKVTKEVDVKEVEMDEFGLSPEIYTENQINFIKQTIETYYSSYDISTPYQKNGVIRLSKLECNMNELEVRVAKYKLKDDINNLKALQDMHDKLSTGLKLTTKQAADGEKGEDIIANACIAFEERFINDKFDFPSIDLRDKLADIITDKADKLNELMKESKTYYHFKQALISDYDIEMSDAEDIGQFTIEEFFDFLKINQDRKMIEGKNEMTFDDTMVFKDDGGLDE